MTCPVCDALHRENQLACQIEASVILQQRSDLTRTTNESPDGLKIQQRHEAVVVSRKQQLEIASRLHKHRALAHSA